MLSHILIFYLVSSSLATQQSILKDGKAGPLDERFAHLVDETLGLWQVPGLSLAVIDGDDVFSGVSSRCNLILGAID